MNLLAKHLRHAFLWLIIGVLAVATSLAFSVPTPQLALASRRLMMAQTTTTSARQNSNNLPGQSRWRRLASPAVSETNTLKQRVGFSGPLFAEHLRSVTAAATSTAVFVKTDSTTQGNWRGIYGAQGYSLANSAARFPNIAPLALADQLVMTWAESTAEVRALQKPEGDDRLAAAWYSATSFTLGLNLIDGAQHRVALYCVDWDQRGRAQRIEVLDAETATVLDSRDLSNFQGGQYLVWTLRGHVQLRVTNVGNENAVVSGLFIDAAVDDPVTSVVAGAGLTGGGKGGEVTLAIAEGGVNTAQLADGAISGAKIGVGQVVKSLNGLTDNLTLAAGEHVSLTPSGNTLTISATSLGTITGVTAGTGLIGGGNSGNLMLAVSTGGVDAAQLADGAVTSPKLAAGAVGSAQLANGAVGTNQLADNAVTGTKIAPGQIVRSLNGLTDNLALAAGSNVSLTPSGNTLTISAAGSITGVVASTGLTGGGTSGNVGLGIANGGVGTAQLANNAVTSAKIASGQVVKSLNGLREAVTLQAGANVTLTPSGNSLTIAVPNLGGWTKEGAVVRLSNSADRIGIGKTNPLRTLQFGDSPDAAFTVEPADITPNAGYIRFGDRTGWKLHFGRSREFSAGPLNSGTTGVMMTLQDNGNIGVGTTTPQAKLDVRGDIRLGPSGQYRATGGEENLRIVRGVIDGSGNIIVGSGFRVSRTEEGKYTITFDTPFAGPPAVTATGVGGGFVSAYATTGGVTGSTAEIRINCPDCGLYGVNLTDRTFHFIAIGPR